MKNTTMKKRILFYMSTLLLLISCANTETTESIKNVDVSQAKELLKTDITLLDVRTAQEVAAGKIEGAINIDFYSPTFKEDVNKLDKTKPILVYCKSGGRSSSAAGILNENGFTTIYNLLGGYSSWSRK